MYNALPVATISSRHLPRRSSTDSNEGIDVSFVERRGFLDDGSGVDGSDGAPALSVITITGSKFDERFLRRRGSADDDNGDDEEFCSLSSDAVRSILFLVVVVWDAERSDSLSPSEESADDTSSFVLSFLEEFTE